jgi:hypothetical protein
MYKFISTLFLLAAFITTAAQKIGYSLLSAVHTDTAQLRREFLHPPFSSRLRCYWWWLNSMTTKETITRDLEEMKRNGYGGASIVDAGSSNYTVAAKTKAGPVFMSPEWMELYRHAVKEADRLQIELSVNTQSGWNPGGPTITPELALKKIVYTETKITGGKKIVVPLPEPENNLIYRDIMVQAFRQPSADFPLRDSAIANWRIKSFNASFGFKGTYPLYKLRDIKPGTEKNPGIDPGQIITLTAQTKNGILTWDVPEGEWTVIRYGYTCTGAETSTNSDGWHGLSVDHLSKKAFEKFSNDVIIPLITTAQSAGKSLHFLQTDSWEMGNVSWTEDFPAAFRKYRGYDIRPFMPVLAGRIVGNVDLSNRFLADYRKTIGDCIAANHYQPFSDLAHSYGLGFHPESGGPHSAPVDALRVLAINDFPQGEFWAMSNTHRIKDDERLSVKQSASAAHTNGKRYVAAEGPTSIGPQWERSPRDLKANIDRVFCSGVNRIVWHTFTSSPKEFGLPGNEYFAGTHMNPNVTWWKQAKEFISYLNRCSYLLSQGLFAADVLYYYGDDVPNFVFLKEEFTDAGFGYDWDKCSKEALLKNVSYRNNRIVFPDGMQYRLLVLPPETAIDLSVLRKVQMLVRAGMTVVGPRPLQTNSLTQYPQADLELKAIADSMWGPLDGVNRTEHSYGKGKVIWGKNIRTVLQEMNIQPDLSFTSTQPDTQLDYIHRTSDNADIYFVANRFGRKGINDFAYRYLPDLPDRYEQVECAFRVTGKVPERWDPVTGRTSPVPVYREENGKTIIPLAFEPEGSVFIIFRKTAPQKHVVAIDKDGQHFFPGNQLTRSETAPVELISEGGKIQTLLHAPGSYRFTWSDGTTTQLQKQTANNSQTVTGKWKISFDTAWGGPAQIQTDTLRSWIGFAEEGIRYYSGTALYSNIFQLTPESIQHKKLMLDLGNVLEMASVKINGSELPVRWCAPFAFDISRYVKAGNNTLEVTVVNLWPNRLIGDSKLPKTKRFTKTNIMKYDAPDSEKLLRESGLLGPVRITCIDKAPLK